jgi:hypothetical protein
MAVSLIRRIFTISLLYKTAQEGTSKKMQGHPLHVLIEQYTVRKVTIKMHILTAGGNVSVCPWHASDERLFHHINT